MSEVLKQESEKYQIEITKVNNVIVSVNTSMEVIEFVKVVRYLNLKINK